MTTSDAYAAGLAHGYEIATMRAQSRQMLGLPIVRTNDDEGMLTDDELAAGLTVDDRAPVVS